VDGIIEEAAGTIAGGITGEEQALIDAAAAEAAGMVIEPEPEPEPESDPEPDPAGDDPGEPEPGDDPAGEPEPAGEPDPDDDPDDAAAEPEKPKQTDEAVKAGAKAARDAMVKTLSDAFADDEANLIADAFTGAMQTAMQGAVDRIIGIVEPALVGQAKADIVGSDPDAASVWDDIQAEAKALAKADPKKYKSVGELMSAAADRVKGREKRVRDKVVQEKAAKHKGRGSAPASRRDRPVTEDSYVDMVADMAARGKTQAEIDAAVARMRR
jgi:hypothetical protein